MARIRPPARPLNFGEPLWPRRSFSVWNKPPVIPEGCDPEVAAQILRDHEEGEKNPAWAVWGTALFDPEHSLAPADDAGEPVPGGGVVCTITHCKGYMQSVPAPEHWAKRFAECVNAFRGIASPGVFLADVVALLGDIARDEDFNFGERAGALLARVQKPVFETEPSQ